MINRYVIGFIGIEVVFGVKVWGINQSTITSHH